jgi:hypothetical protein
MPYYAILPQIMVRDTKEEKRKTKPPKIPTMGQTTSFKNTVPLQIVGELKWLSQYKGFTARELAAIYKLNAGTVTNILLGHSRMHVEPVEPAVIPNHIPRSKSEATIFQYAKYDKGR